MADRREIGFITLGVDYVEAAVFLFEGKVTFRHAGPVEFLYAHGLELLLKGALLCAGKSVEEVEAFRHRVLELYDAARQEEKLRSIFVDLEGHVRDQWRTRLRNARDERAARPRQVGSDIEVTDSFLGIHDNETIGKELPEFRPQVCWLDERHGRGGGLFRYHETRMDRRGAIRAFGLDDDVVLQSMHWGCRFLAEKLQAVARKERL